MSKSNFFRLFLTFILFGLTACGSNNESVAQTETAIALANLPTETNTPLPPTATATATATATHTPPPTATPTMTATPEPTATPTMTPSPTPVPITLEEEQEVAEGGFVFRPVTDYTLQVNQSLVTIASPDDEIIMSLIGDVNPDNLPLEQVLDNFLANVSADIDEFEHGDPYPFVVAEIEGLAVDFTGVLFNEAITGQIVAIAPSETQLFLAMAFAVNGADSNRWLYEGHDIFVTVLEAVTFFSLMPTATAIPPTTIPPTATTAPVSNSACTVSTNPSYGYTQENAIKVGGDFFAGPARETAYLNVLRGPSGETISYFRAGSIPFGDVILDIYQLSYGSQTITLYLDMYNYEPPIAPAGLTCASPVPFGAP